MNKKFIDWQNTSTEDIIANPHAFGLPTFDEYCKVKEKFSMAPDVFGAMDNGPSQFRKDLKKMKFFVHGKPIPNPEMLDRILSDEGYSNADIKFGSPSSRLKHEINHVPVGGGLDHEVHINFLP